MKQVGKYNFVGECECGYKHSFKKNEINYKKSDASVAIFNNIFTCPECKTEYDGMFVTIKSNNKLGFSPTGTLIVVLLLGSLAFGGYKVLSPIFNHPESKTITNKEYQDFKKWDQKQKQKEWENQPVDNRN
jgi:hypothetical protein